MIRENHTNSRSPAKPFLLKVRACHIIVSSNKEEFPLRHFNILSTVLVLLVGAWAVFHFQQKSRRFPDSRLRYLLRYLVLFNVSELAVFFLVYFSSNLAPPQLRGFYSLLKGIDWPLRSLLILGMYVFQYKTIAWLRDKELPRGFVPALFSYLAVMMTLFWLGMRFPAYMPESPLLNFWNLYVWPLILLQAAWLFRLLAENRQGADPDRARCNRAFARLFLCLILLQLVVQVLNTLPYYYWTISFYKLLILYTDLMPVFWLTRYFSPWAGSLGKIIGRGLDMERLQKERGLSVRELEIIKLLIDGKSYKQMEDALFISIHTVKSHVYSLYRKMNVKSRHQLLHMASTLRRDTP
jgi:DNA-binding CsgD family transcriptional regulator